MNKEPHAERDGAAAKHRICENDPCQFPDCRCAPSAASGLELDALLDDLQAETSGYEQASRKHSKEIDESIKEIRAKIHALLRSRPAQGATLIFNQRMIEDGVKVLSAWPQDWGHARIVEEIYRSMHAARVPDDAAMSQQEKRDG